MQEICPKSIQEWRNWLEKNHLIESKVIVIRHKKHTGVPSPSPQQLMHEAICFGWIDTTAKRLDEDRYIINYSRRSKNSKWSKNTLSYAKSLIKQGKMSPNGLKEYQLGLSRPILGHGIPDNPNTPKDLMKLLKTSSVALSNFKSLSPSMKRVNLRWILSAKMPETRQKRVNAVFHNMLNKKKNPFQ